MHFFIALCLVFTGIDSSDSAIKSFSTPFWKRSLSSSQSTIKAAGDKLLMNKFIRPNFGGGRTLKSVDLDRLGADFVET